MEKEDKKEMESTLAEAEKDSFIISLRNPIDYEGERHDRIDLSGLHEIKAADMITVNRRLTRSGNIDSSQEISLEYALHMAHIATGMPFEFFEQLPPYAALAVKGRVISFLSGRA